MPAPPAAAHGGGRRPRLRLGPAGLRPDVHRPVGRRRRAARRGGRLPRHLPLPARAARARVAPPGRAVHRPVAHLPARPAGRAVGRRAAARRHDPRRCATTTDAEAVNRIYAPQRHGHGAGRRPRRERRARRRSCTWSPSSDATGVVVGTVTGVDHVAVFDDPESGSSLWCLTADPQRRAARRRPGAAAGAGRAARRARPRLRRPVGARRQRAARSGSTSGSASAACRCSA